MNEHSEALGAPRQVFESCTIIAWKGYRRFEFCAMSLADGELIARTSGFRKRGSAPVESAEARAALDRLVGYLTAVGWETRPAAEGAAWYATRFVRPLPASADEPETHVLAEPAGLAQALEERVRAEVLRQTPAPVPVHAFAAAAPAANHLPAETLPTEQVAETPQTAPSFDDPAPHALERDRRARRARRGKVLALVALPVAIVEGLWISLGGAIGAAPAQQAPTHRLRPAVAHPTSLASATAVRAAAPHTKPVRLTLTTPASRHGSWVELHTDSKRGPLLFAGELAPGQTLHFAARAVWARFGSAGNIALTLNGRHYQLFGTLTTVFTPAGPQKP